MDFKVWMIEKSILSSCPRTWHLIAWKLVKSICLTYDLKHMLWYPKQLMPTVLSQDIISPTECLCIMCRLWSDICNPQSLVTISYNSIELFLPNLSLVSAFGMESISIFQTKYFRWCFICMCFAALLFALFLTHM